MTPYMRWLDRGFDDLRRAVAVVGRRPRGLLGARSGSSSSVEGGYDPVLGDRAMPGAEWFPGAQVNYAEHASAASPTTRVAIVHALRAARAGRADVGRAARAGRARIAAGLRALGVGRGDRVAAYMPNIPEAVAAFLATRLDRRRLVELLARLRRAQRDRPLRADRAEGAAGRRRLPLRRQATSTAARPSPASHARGRRRARARSATSTARAGRTASSATTPSSSSSACRSTTRCGSCTPRARPGCRRRSSRARAASCSSTSRSCTCTSTRRRATASSGSRRPAG